MAYLVPLICLILKRGARALQKKPNPATYDEQTDRVTAQPLILILAPTRELCLQIAQEARALTYQTPVRVCSVYGGGSRQTQVADLGRGCDILVATPGRLKDILSSHPGALSLERASYVQTLRI